MMLTAETASASLTTGWDRSEDHHLRRLHRRFAPGGAHAAGTGRVELDQDVVDALPAIIRADRSRRWAGADNAAHQDVAEVIGRQRERRREIGIARDLRLEHRRQVFAP